MGGEIVLREPKTDTWMKTVRYIYASGVLLAEVPTRC